MKTHYTFYNFSLISHIYKLTHTHTWRDIQIIKPFTSRLARKSAFLHTKFDDKDQLHKYILYNICV